MTPDQLFILGMLVGAPIGVVIIKKKREAQRKKDIEEKLKKLKRSL